MPDFQSRATCTCRSAVYDADPNCPFHGTGQIDPAPEQATGAVRPCPCMSVPPAKRPVRDCPLHGDEPAPESRYEQFERKNQEGHERVEQSIERMREAVGDGPPEPVGAWARLRPLLFRKEGGYWHCRGCGREIPMHADDCSVTAMDRAVVLPVQGSSMTEPVGERWKITICPGCGEPARPSSSGQWRCICGHTLREVREVEVVPLSVLTAEQQRRNELQEAVNDMDAFHRIQGQALLQAERDRAEQAEKDRDTATRYEARTAARLSQAEQALEATASRADEIAEWLQRDCREPDKTLCHAQSLRRLATDTYHHLRKGQDNG